VGLVSFIFFHFFVLLSSYLTNELFTTQSLRINPDDLSLPDFIIESCNQLKFEDIEKERRNFNFEMMIISEQFFHIHKHSVIFGKLITAHNSRLYLLNLFSNYFMLVLWMK